jgi:hypothetical protein
LLGSCGIRQNGQRAPAAAAAEQSESFTALRDPATRLPIKKLSSCVIEKDGIWRLSAVQTSDAFTIDAQTGRPLPARTDVVFVDFT